MPNPPNAALPWDALRHAEGDIPWPALEQFAQALAADPGLCPKLRALYEGYFDSDDPQPSYECLYVPAIFAMAAPRLGAAVRREIADFLVGELVAAGEEDDEVMMEVMETAAGTMGPVALPAVLSRLDELTEDDAEWYNVWSLTALAAHTDDRELRQGTAGRCVEALEKAVRDEIDPMDACMPAITLAKMRHAAARPLIERLYKSTDNPELGKVLATMDGKGRDSDWRDPWDQPVREWLAAHWEALHEDYTSTPGGEEGDGESEDGVDDSEV